MLNNVNVISTTLFNIYLFPLSSSIPLLFIVSRSSQSLSESNQSLSIYLIVNNVSSFICIPYISRSTESHFYDFINFIPNSTDPNYFHSTLLYSSSDS